MGGGSGKPGEYPVGAAPRGRPDVDFAEHVGALLAAPLRND